MGKLVLNLFILCFIEFVICANSTINISESNRGDILTQGGEEYTAGDTADAKALHGALKGLGTNDETIVSIVTQRSNYERQQIRKAYKHLYFADLIEDLKGDLSGHYKDIVLALMLEPDEFIAKELHKSLTSISALISCYPYHFEEILAIKTGAKLSEIKKTYKKLYNTTLEGDFNYFAYDDKYKDFINAILKNGRKPAGINTEIAKEQVTLFLNESATDCNSDDDDALVAFFANENFEQIQYVASLYELNSNQTGGIEHLIHEWCSDESIRHSYLTVLRYSKNPIKYYSEELHDSMIGLGTRDSKLIRIIVGRSEKDLDEIKTEYEKMYSRTLISSVEADTSGYYKTILVSLIKEARSQPLLDMPSL